MQLCLTPLRQAPRRGGSTNPQNALKGSPLITKATPTLCFLFPCVQAPAQWESWGRGPDVAPALDSPFFFFLRSLPLFSRGWHKGKAEVPWRLHSEASPPTEEKLWPICGLLSCQEEAPSREIGLFFFFPLPRQQVTALQSSTELKATCSSPHSMGLRV